MIFSLFERREKKQFILILFVLLIMGFVELVGVGSISPFISVVSNPNVIHTNKYLAMAYDYFQFTSDGQFIVILGIGVIVVLTLSNVCLSLINFIIYFFSAKKEHTLSMRLLEKYLRQPYLFFLNVNSAELSRNILGDIGSFINNVLIKFLNLISALIISLSIITLLILINPLLALLISLILSLSYIVIFAVVRNFLARKGVERSVQNTLRYKFINEIFGGIKDIKILGKEKVFMNFFFLPSKKYTMNNAISEVVNDLPKYILETIAFSGIIGIIIFMIISGSKIDEFLPTLTVYAFAAYRLLPTLHKIFRAIASIKYHMPIIDNLYRDFRQLPDGNILTDDEIPKMELSNSINLKHIVFSYPRTHKDIINNQDIVIEANTSIALVGSTGCGKTTFADILLGLLSPQSGEISVDGREINDTNRKQWQKNLGYVPQSIYLTDDTIRNNIAFGVSPEKINEDSIIQAAKLANIHDFVVHELESGYDTIIGERGIRLSGGQRQRVGIARAIYHDPSVLIFDEATSALDSLTENAIMDAIKNIRHKKTIIIIAHRITTVKHCDVIYMMDKGKFVDHGTYEELYTRNEVFRVMADGGI
jgi:ABC-type multidrug transport system fused ATPase/permease subunit